MIDLGFIAKLVADCTDEQLQALLRKHDVEPSQMTDSIVDMANAMGPEVGQWVDEEHREYYRIFLAMQTGFILGLKYTEEVKKFREEVPSTEEG